MKKLITSTIIILPLLLLAILLVSGTVLGVMNVHIYVSSVYFVEETPLILDVDNINDPPTFDLRKEITVLPHRASKADELTYIVQNPDILKVSDKGIVTPLLYGETYVTVQSVERKDASDTRKIIVTCQSAKNIVMNDAPQTLKVGQSARLSVSMYPIDATNRGVVWTTSDEEGKILRVSENGTVTALAEGTVDVIATNIDNKALTAKTTIICQEDAPENLTVYAGGKTLTSGSYKTVADELTLVVKGGANIEYQTNNTSWKSVQGGKVTINTQNINTVDFRSGSENINLNIQKVSLEDAQVEIFATVDSNAGASVMTLKKFETMKNAEDTEVFLSKYIQNSITIKFDMGENFVGDFVSNENFETLFALNLHGNKDWQVFYDYLNMEVTLKFPKQQTASQQLSVTLGETTLDMNIMFALAEIGFTGFDSNVYEDVHKGYQQVRVFAKHSYYDEKDVDYFKVPFRAVSNLTDKDSVSPDLISWTLSRYVGKDRKSVLTSQHGTHVTYNDTDYEIVEQDGEYVLKRYSNGEVQGDAVSGVGGKNTEGIIWVDTYTEKNYARIYFGNFAGLTESDVYNDYFGAFNDDESWTTPAQAEDTKGGGITIQPSPNAYAFLKVEASDGAVGGKNCHFNFNVLDSEDVFNVFDAKGFMAKRSLVLHETLYGEGELEEGETLTRAQEKGLILTDPYTTSQDGNGNTIYSDVLSKMTKDVMYGNGNEVNFNAENEFWKVAKPNAANYDAGANFGSIYNIKLEGAKESTVVSKTEQKVNFSFKNAFYCDISYYGFCSTPNEGMHSYVKNCAFRCTAHEAFKLYRDGEEAYFEDSVAVECMTALYIENMNVKYYFKGFFDVLNYYNKESLKSALGINDFVVSLVMPVVQPYLEWHGETSTDMNAFYVNVVVWSQISTPKPGEWLYQWNDGEYQLFGTETENAATGAISGDFTNHQNEKYQMQHALAYGSYHAYSYHYDPATEGAELKVSNNFFDWDTGDVVKTCHKDLSKLFTRDRYIRLPCQFKNIGVKNDDHIMWHIQQVSRDPSLIKGRPSDHIESLTDSLKGTTWADGTGVDAEGQIIYKTVSEASHLTSFALPPKKYAV